ncbi:GNAT family N-acetyltransferase [Corynebacterium sp. NML120713]|uniref:GNAT family N-acetyltransferase n=1 Tax=Corynebacterium sp. NML120713 TaxID=1906332 RepID=UPI0008FB72F3|nr:GNAT family N-acetyltransferase [Corynebacterium sp. NML120713]OIR44521.1 GNAT family N-acetyltransferase [Corynebacterium sp. NML120713]
MTQNKSFTLRQATESDRMYLQRLNFLADVFGDETAPVGHEERLGVTDYVDHWDPERDGGIIACDEFRTPAGGVWLRYWDTPDAGHANLGPDVPELAIAVERRFAGHRLGAKLLRAVIELAAQQGAPRVALWVDPDNERARHRYEQFGFTAVADVANVMVFDCNVG